MCSPSAALPTNLQSDDRVEGPPRNFFSRNVRRDATDKAIKVDPAAKFEQLFRKG
ncbi:hypothetical protein K443DRAFT_680175 [Laccaria amethystina LaAM-08-1]|uniref:Uncharacterized protein n=1 Tax=Laccaria amethystina LaAM-08-1 TaxID=1095629 RepID=A0A0C9X2A4_9AGAR|nr:hypothetical protein K443DRAFT_680175 [Laccaria amethystina LaAM-08-1]